MRSTREWFVSRDGKVEGPISTAFIRDRLAQGELTPLDQICQAGDVSDRQWKLIYECADFIQDPGSGATALSASAAEWVLLRQTSSGQFSLKRSGPYTTDDLASLLREGHVEFKDYVWKKGFQRWAQLETLRDFNHALPHEPPKLEIVRNLTHAELPPVPAAGSTPVPAEPMAAEPMAATAVIAHVAPNLEPTPVWARAAVAFMISLGVMLALASLRPFKKFGRHSASHTALHEGLAAGQSAAYLQILPLAMQSHPQLQFDMSAPSKTYVQVQITGREGQILHKIRYQQTLTLQKKGDDSPVLDLATLGLPNGSYDVVADDGAIRTNQQIFIGDRDASFEAELAAHRTEIADQALIERRAVYDLAARLSAMIDQLEPSGTSSATDWSDHYAQWTADFQRLTRSAALDQPASQSATPALLQAAQSLAKTVSAQAVAFDASIKGQSSQVTKIPVAELKNELRRLQVQASAR